MLTTMTKPLVLLVSLCVALPLAAQSNEGFDALALSDSTTALLAGHLLIRLPEEARVEARAYDLMAAPEPDESETRAVIDVGSRRFVVFARELNRIVVDSLEQATSLALRPYEESFGPLDFVEVDLEDPRLRGVIGTPQKREPVSNAILVKVLVVANVDDTVQEIGFYVNPEGASDWEAVETLASRISATIQAGSRVVSAESRTVYLVQSDSSQIALRIPDGFAYTPQRGPDFIVHRVEALVPLGERGRSLGIYDGNHPSWRATSAEGLAREVLGQRVLWELTEEGPGDGTTYHADVLVENPLYEWGYFHLFVTADSALARERLIDIASAMQVVE